MSLRIEDTILVPTKTGEYQIQLCYGDITKQEEKMDIIMVSAFPGDYAAVGGTLIGALKRNLDIDVKELAKKKEMDLRTHFSCWMSKELDKDLPFKRLLCFERSRAKGDVVEQIREMFRVFVPACGNQETTVITPLLGTGNQGFSQTVILSCMVETAANWMKAGLPLKCIKLVIYSEGDSNMNKLFSALKKTITDKSIKREEKAEIKYDLFITYEEGDKEWATMVTKVFQAKNKDLRIYTELQKFDKNKTWQDSVFKIMSCCQKIVAILTPSFVNSKDCLDLFNMAMCCNRLKNSEMLFPFLVTSVDSMPVYMKLVQYFDCRIRKDGDVLSVKIDQACSFLMNPTSKPPNPTDDDDQEERYQYDIFISYSHRQPQHAEQLLQMMTSANSDLKIFFDRSELTMGSMWQSSLYESLDRSECIIALVSPSYFSSVVCTEEYNIALARHLAWPSGVLFIPVLVEPMETVPSHFSRICMIDGRGEKFKKVAENLTEKIIEWRRTKSQIPYIQNPVDKFSFSFIENNRKDIVERNYALDKKMKTLNPVIKMGTLMPSADGNIDIAVSFARDTTAYAVTLSQIFGMNNDKLQIAFLNENSQKSLQDLDKARQILVILSKEYMQSSQHMQELHVALCRQRDAKKTKIVRILVDKNLPEKPMFVHLLPCETNLSDSIWTTFHKQCGSLNEQKAVMSYKAGMKGSFMISYGIYFALQKTAFDVLINLSGSNQETDSEIPPIICNILAAKLKDTGYPSSVQVSGCLIDLFSDNREVKIQPIKEKENKANENKKSDITFEPSAVKTETEEKDDTQPNGNTKEPVIDRKPVVRWADEDDGLNSNHKKKAADKQEVEKTLEIEVPPDEKKILAGKNSSKSGVCNLL